MSSPFKSETCVYAYPAKKGAVVILTLYVGDLRPFKKGSELLEILKKKLVSRFKMKDKGNVSFVLGMQVTRDREKGTLTISQQGYHAREV